MSRNHPARHPHFDVEVNDLASDGSRVLTAGHRDGSGETYDYDITSGRFNALDTIFADRSGAPAPD